MIPIPPTLSPLHQQVPSYASIAAKIRLSMLATAMVDALGGPAEFCGRFTFDPITTMIPNDNFDLEPGVWTDDTSMMLCLARSITRSPKEKDGFDEKNQLQRYLAWFHHGELSATGQCFDIGNTIRRALSMFQAYQSQPAEDILGKIKGGMSGEFFGGNGSLMRILPIGLAYWRDETKARTYANRSSCTTHPNSLCVEACEVWTLAIAKIMQAIAAKSDISKLDVLEHFTHFPYSNPKLRDALTLPTSTLSPPTEASRAEKEGHYWLHHPLLLKVAQVGRGETAREIPGLPYPMPTDDEVPSSGYVLHSLIAALYCFMSTQTFEEGAVTAVNMGSDADTVGAIYAGLAGVWYGEEEHSGRFWTEKVKSWRDELVKRDLVEQVADEFEKFVEGLGGSS